MLGINISWTLPQSSNNTLHPGSRFSGNIQEKAVLSAERRFAVPGANVPQHVDTERIKRVGIQSNFYPGSLYTASQGETVTFRVRLEGLTTEELKGFRVLVRTDARSFDAAGEYIEHDIELKEKESERDIELRPAADGSWMAEITAEHCGAFYVTAYIVDPVTNARKWLGGSNAFLTVLPAWGRGASIAVSSLRMMREHDPENTERLGTFTDLIWDIKEKAKLGFNALLLLPLTAPIKHGPYEQLSPYALNPEHIDWGKVSSWPWAVPERAGEDREVLRVLGEHTGFQNWFREQEEKGVAEYFEEYAILRAINLITEQMQVNTAKVYAKFLALNKLVERGIIKLEKEEVEFVRQMVRNIGDYQADTFARDALWLESRIVPAQADRLKEIIKAALARSDKPDMVQARLGADACIIAGGFKRQLWDMFCDSELAAYVESLKCFFIYEQYIAQQQLGEALAIAAESGVNVLFDQPFFPCLAGTIGVFHPDWLEWENEETVRYAGWTPPGEDQYKVHWGNLGCWRYRPGLEQEHIVGSFRYWLRFGFSGFRWDALHFGNERLWRYLSDCCIQGKAVLPIGEQLGGTDEVQQKLLELGYVLYQGTEFRKESIRRLEDTLIGANEYIWFVTSDTHDSPRLYDLFKEYFLVGEAEEADIAMVNRAMLTQFAFASSIFCMVSGSEYGVTERMQTHSPTDRWNMASPQAESARHCDLTEQVKKLNELRHNHPAMKATGNLVRLTNRFSNESSEQGGVSTLARVHQQGSLVLINNLSGCKQTVQLVDIPFATLDINPYRPYRVRNQMTGEERDYLNTRDLGDFTLMPGEGIILEFLPQAAISAENWERQLVGNTAVTRALARLTPLELQQLIYGSVRPGEDETFIVTSHGENLYEAPYAGLMGLKFIFAEETNLPALNYHVLQGHFCEFLATKVLVGAEFAELRNWFYDFLRLPGLADAKRELFSRAIDNVIDNVAARIAGDIPGITSVDEATRTLALTALSFVSEKEEGILDGDGKVVPTGSYVGIDAGHPHFIGGMGDWGRDTFISLPGLLLSTGRYDDARRVILNYARIVRRGMIPNLFDFGITPRYNTIDASLWYFQAVREYVAQVPNGAEILNERVVKKYIRPNEGDKEEYTLWEILEEMIECHIQGIHFVDDANDPNLPTMDAEGRKIDIYMDPADKLLAGGNAFAQLTWMDERVGGVASTPRHGKAVEINALWYNALSTMAELAAATGKDGAVGDWYFVELAAQVKKSFNNLFWFAEGGYLYDVVECVPQADGIVNTITEHSKQLRPNQLFALSIREELVPAERKKRALEVVQRLLWTQHGLRTLTPDDGLRQYHGAHRREIGSYHNGTVWSWLVGAFMDAYYQVYAEDPAHDVKDEMRQLLQGLVAHVWENHYTIAEIFNGDPPHAVNWCGTFSQAWSVAELLRISLSYLDGQLQIDEESDIQPLLRDELSVSV